MCELFFPTTETSFSWFVLSTDFRHPGEWVAHGGYVEGSFKGLQIKLLMKIFAKVSYFLCRVKMSRELKHCTGQRNELWLKGVALNHVCKVLGKCVCMWHTHSVCVCARVHACAKWIMRGVCARACVPVCEVCSHMGKISYHEWLQGTVKKRVQHFPPTWQLLFEALKAHFTAGKTKTQMNCHQFTSDT